MKRTLKEVESSSEYSESQESEPPQKKLKTEQTGKDTKIKSINKLNKMNAKMAKSGTTRVICWLRNDLRLKDNYVFAWAKQQSKEQRVEVIPVFCFDPRYYLEKESKTKWKTRKTGANRAQFMLETVEDLRNNLKGVNSNLLVTSE